jgi:DNA primase
MMPEGQDPDDVLKASGAGAFRKLLDGAVPMVQLLWQREIEGRVFDSPERKAALDKALRDKIMLIKDPSIRSHYGQEIKDLRWKLFRPQSAPRAAGQRGEGGKWSKEPPYKASVTAKSSVLGAASNEQTTEHLREAVILAACVRCPEVIEQFEGGLEAMACLDRDHAAIRDVMLLHAGAEANGLRENIYSALGPDALENLLAQRHVALMRWVRGPADANVVRLVVAEELAKLEAVRGQGAEIAEAVEEFGGEIDEGLTWRLSQAARTVIDVYKPEDGAAGDFVKAENGALLEADELKASRSVFDNIVFSKGKKPPPG